MMDSETPTMKLLLLISVFLLPPLVVTQNKHSLLDSIPRKHVPLHEVKVRRFHKSGTFNYTAMMLMEDQGLLLLGTKDLVIAVDLHDISKLKASLRWEAKEDSIERCLYMQPEELCHNFIKILHRIDDHRIYMCGTHAFYPLCVNMTYSDGKLTLDQIVMDGKGRCPRDPRDKSASVFVENQLFSATHKDFARVPMICRSGICNIEQWFFKDATFVSMSSVPESENSPIGQNDQIYLFFNEEAEDFNSDFNPLVPRVSRVCKGDRGGKLILQKKWTSFLKARVDCPLHKNQWSYVIEDTYLLCEPKQQNCTFYAIFRPQRESDGTSAVCAYRLSDIHQVFSKGNFKTENSYSTSQVWQKHTGEVPTPRPGNCVPNSLELPMETLQFVSKTSLMSEAVQPLGGKPLLLRRGVKFNHIIVSQVKAADDQKYEVMFVGTDDGTVLKSVNYDGEMFTIEEMQIFPPQVPITSLTFSSVTNQLYAGSDTGVAQIPLARCDRCSSCVDCVLSKDPYCGWDGSTGMCVALSVSTRPLIQSVQDGNANLCPGTKDSVPLTEQSTWSGADLKLRCPVISNLATVSWKWDNRPLSLSDRVQQQEDGLLILSASGMDSGRYDCLSVEASKAGQYSTTVAKFNVVVQSDSSMMAAVQGLGVVVGLLMCLIGFLSWTVYKQHQFHNGTKEKTVKAKGQVSKL